MNGNIAVIYARDLAAVAEAFGEAAGHLATRVRLLRVGGDEAMSVLTAIRAPGSATSSGPTGSRSAPRSATAPPLPS